MKEIIYNKDNLKDNELDETVIRIKAVIINNKDEILLGNVIIPTNFQEDI